MFFVKFQQLDSVVVGTENARRYFKGIAGNRKRYGELFGIKNMFQLHMGDSSRTMDILQVSSRGYISFENKNISQENAFGLLLLPLIYIGWTHCIFYLSVLYCRIIIVHWRSMFVGYFKPHIFVPKHMTK